MLKCISYWSFEGGPEQTKRHNDAFIETKEAGFDGLELTIGETGLLNLEINKKECEEIVSIADTIGISHKTVASGIPWQYSLTDNNKEIRNKGIEYVKKMIAITNWLQADRLLLVPGAVDIFFRNDYEKIPYDICFKRSKESIFEFLNTAENLNVNLCIENVGNKFLLSPLEMKDFIDSFGSAKVGAYLDVGNVLYNGGYAEDWIKILGKRIKAIHFKDYKNNIGGINGFCELLEGDVDWKLVMESIKSINYDGTITAEMLPPSKGLIERTSVSMDKILGRNEI